MNVFLLVAALMGVLAAAFVLLPALRRRPHRGPGGTAPPSARTRAERLLLAGIALGLPALAGGLYLLTGGGPSAFAPGSTGLEAESTEGERRAVTMADDPAEGRIEALLLHLESQPEDVGAWTRLGHGLLLLQRYAEAAEAFARASHLAPNDPQLLADQAGALMRSAGPAAADATRRLSERALILDPNNEKALWISGLLAFDQGRYALALVHWNRLSTVLPPDSPLLAPLSQQVAEARRRGGAPPPEMPAGGTL